MKKYLQNLLESKFKKKVFNFTDFVSQNETIENTSFINPSLRIKAIAYMINSGTRVADIGTDHAYLPIYLVQQNIAKSAIASDINRGPLEIATKNIEKAGLSEKIETRISNGLENFKAKEMDTIVITGMGGKTIIDILNGGVEVVRYAKYLIMSPQSEIVEFRLFLATRCFKIIDEIMVKEDGKYYYICKVKNAKASRFQKELLGIKFGHLLLTNKDEVLKEYIHKQRQEKDKLLKKLTGYNIDEIGKLREKNDTKAEEKLENAMNLWNKRGVKVFRDVMELTMVETMFFSNSDNIKSKD